MKRKKKKNNVNVNANGEYVEKSKGPLIWLLIVIGYTLIMLLIILILGRDNNKSNKQIMETTVQVETVVGEGE
ncbi:hypothetical protein SAMN02910289_01679 [Lachnospiraceae bacterium RM5]|nr:hypothetical protein SAMN02910289_01679 [Lachnospiraceae bacterium RM5]